VYAVSSAVQVAIFNGPNIYLLLTHIKETVEDASRSIMSSLFLGQVAGGAR